jgi:hypothetical protein
VYFPGNAQWVSILFQILPHNSIKSLAYLRIYTLGLIVRVGTEYNKSNNWYGFGRSCTAQKLASAINGTTVSFLSVFYKFSVGFLQNTCKHLTPPTAMARDLGATSTQRAQTCGRRTKVLPRNTIRRTRRGFFVFF